MIKILILVILTLLSLGGFFRFYLKDKRLSSDVRFGYFLLLLGIIFLLTLIPNVIGLENTHPILVFCSLMFYVVCLCLPPAMYFYNVSLFKTPNSEKILTDSKIHFYPALVLLVINLFSFVALYSLDVGSSNYILLNTIRTYANFLAIFFIFLLQNVFYIYSSIVLFQGRKLIVQELKIADSNNSLNWMKWFIITYTLLIFILYFFQLDPFSPWKIISRILLIFYLINILYMGNRNMEFHLEDKKTQKLDQNTRILLVDKLTNIMESEKPYLDNSLNIQSLAHSVGTNTKYLSYAINEEFDQNFSTYINTHRIEDAKEMLANSENNKFTIEFIATSNGFKSKSSFNAAFKKYNSQTPSEYRNQHQR